MAQIDKVKEAVKEGLVGSEEPVQVSAQTKARFTANAIKDPATGELYLGPDEFTNAVVPSGEDYVSFPVSSLAGDLCFAPHARGHLRDVWKLTMQLMSRNDSTRSSVNSIRSCFA